MCIFLCMSNSNLATAGPGKLFELNLKPRTEEAWRKWFLTWSPVYRPCIFLLLFLSRSFFIFFFFFPFFCNERRSRLHADDWEFTLKFMFELLWGCFYIIRPVNLFHWFVFLSFFLAEFIFSFQSFKKWERESQKSWQWWYWHDASTLKHTHTHTHTDTIIAIPHFSDAHEHQK